MPAKNIPWTLKVVRHIAEVLAQAVLRNKGEEAGDRPFHGITDADLEKVLLHYLPKTPVTSAPAVQAPTPEDLSDKIILTVEDGAVEIEELATTLGVPQTTIRELAANSPDFQVWGSRVKNACEEMKRQTFIRRLAKCPGSAESVDVGILSNEAQCWVHTRSAFKDFETDVFAVAPTTQSPDVDLWLYGAISAAWSLKDADEDLLNANRNPGDWCQGCNFYDTCQARLKLPSD